MLNQPELKVKKEFVENLFQSTINDKEILPVVMKLHNKVNVSEFDIAKKLKMNINNVRNILYKLNEKNLVFSTRKKDKQKGWYIYYWTLNLTNIKAMFEDHQKRKIDDMQNTLQNEATTDYFKCPEGCTRMSSADILHYDYMCPECGTLMQHENTSSLVTSMKKQVHALKNELEEVLKVEVPHLDMGDVEKEMRKRAGGKASKKPKKSAKRKRFIKKKKHVTKKRLRVHKPKKRVKKKKPRKA